MRRKTNGVVTGTGTGRGTGQAQEQTWPMLRVLWPVVRVPWTLERVMWLVTIVAQAEPQAQAQAQ